MAKHSSRKLFLFGKYSLALLLPKKWLTEQGIKTGDVVDLEYFSKRGRVIVKLPKSVPETSPKSKKRKPKGKDSDSDWEPIPQI
ncbi:MAG TPA: AbrB/MazE/SpoVT family DNA-binding domain-containing protein [Candidatus Saccharimonadales bacterium]|nr:AbrB/MazE/SpoVT family DNA-binding domain-containing protein [Candidatus Saccharimonadales bacterium]